jgi:hypothetical protein
MREELFSAWLEIANGQRRVPLQVDGESGQERTWSVR